ncbi:MAG: DUF4325 domain-containing protein [Pseudomonadota bacterium]
MAKIHSDKDVIYVEGKLYTQDVRFFSQELNRTTGKKFYKDITLDFSVCESLFPSFMLPSIALCRKARADHKDLDFTIVHPDEANLRRLFHNANWAHLINDQEYQETTYAGGDHVPAVSFKDGDTQDQVTDKIMDTIMGRLATSERKALHTLEWSINEIMANVLTHANSSLGGLAQASVYPSNNSVEFTVADAGIGIRRSLGEKDDAQALEKAIQEGVTRDPEAGQGNGLYGTYRAATLTQGMFEIVSYHGHLLCKGDEVKPLNLADHAFFPGTSVTVKIGCDDPEALTKALQFSGKIHEMGHDYIEKRYGTDQEGLYRFVMKDESSFFGNRESGKEIYHKLYTLMKAEKGSIIEVDFEGIGIISSSFADEAFGKLFRDCGPMVFMGRIKFKNIDHTIQGLIDRAITQRFQRNGLVNGSDSSAT